MSRVFFGNKIGEYNATTGAAVNAALVSLPSRPFGIAVSGGNLFIANLQIGTIGEYNATTGATVNASLVSGLVFPQAIAVSGGKLFVTQYPGGAPGNTTGKIGVYNASTGATVNSALVSGLAYPYAIAVTGGNLFVTNYYGGTVGEYNATTGATINAALVSGLDRPTGIAVLSNPLGDYNANGIIDAADYIVWRKTAGTQADYNLWRTHFGQTAGSGSGAIANAAVPEPATLVLLMFAVTGWCLRRRRTTEGPLLLELIPEPYDCYQT